MANISAPCIYKRLVWGQSPIDALSSDFLSGTQVEEKKVSSFFFFPSTSYFFLLLHLYFQRHSLPSQPTPSFVSHAAFVRTQSKPVELCADGWQKVTWGRSWKFHSANEWKCNFQPRLQQYELALPGCLLNIRCCTWIMSLNPHTTKRSRNYSNNCIKGKNWGLERDAKWFV